jgi:hypothetical protein
LSLIESMIAEGRRSTESWGWTFVLWGVAYYVALAWSLWGRNEWAWPVTVSIAVIVTIVVALLRPGRHPGTTKNRAVAAIWVALGISMCLLFSALGLSGRLADQHLFMAVVSAILGLANGASSMLLRWRVQFVCAVVWWVASAATCFGSDAQSRIVFLVAIFLCQIVFGIYAMTTGAEERKGRSPVHA